MSAPTSIVYASVWEDGSLYLMARLKGNLGVNITQSTLAAITIKVYSRPDNVLVATLTPAISAVVFDALQTTAMDPRWTKDTVGYNFGYAIPASALAVGDTVYRVEVVFDPVTGDNFALVAQIQTLGLLSS